MNSGEFKVMLGYAAPYRKSLVLCALLMMSESFMALTVPWLGGQLAEGVFSKSTYTALTSSILLILLALFAVQALLKFGNSFLLSRSTEHILADLRIRLYDHLQALPLGFYHQRRNGEILALLTHDIERLSGFITETLPSILPMAITLCGSVLMMLRIDPRLALLIILIVPLFYLVLKIVGRELRPLASQIQEANAGAIAIAEENLLMLPAIKTFTRESYESLRYRQQIDNILHLTAKERRIVSSLSPLLQFLASACMVLVLWLMSTQDNDRTPAEMVSFLLYAALLTRPVSELVDFYGLTRQASGAVERLRQVLTERIESPLKENITLPTLRGEIDFQDVSFAYPNRAPVLSHFNFHIFPGETIALTGPNGAGKSTIINLLMRLIEPGNGCIRIDGIDISEVSLNSLRAQIGVVPQHVLLFNGSVRENIAYGIPDASLQAITAVAKTAQAHQFISKLPQGYDTLIGDQGIRLSGGQRQRIALARALLKAPAILILDEATAMFDPHGEQSFITECKHTLENRTVILITHRPASLALADRIFRLENGQLTIVSSSRSS